MTTKTLEDIKDILDGLPPTTVIRQLYETLHLVMKEAPTRRSELKKFWSNFYKTDKGYQLLKKLVDEFTGAKWLSSLELTSLKKLKSSLAEGEKNSAPMPLTHLDAAIVFVNQRRVLWDPVVKSFDKFHQAMKKENVTAERLNPLFEKLKTHLEDHGTTAGASSMVKKISGALNKKLSSLKAE